MVGSFQAVLWDITWFRCTASEAVLRIETVGPAKAACFDLFDDYDDDNEDDNNNDAAANV